MSNSLFQQLGGNRMGGQMGQFQRMVQDFRQFQASFQGDPKAEVMKLVPGNGAAVPGFFVRSISWPRIDINT